MLTSKWHIFHLHGFSNVGSTFTSLISFQLKIASITSSLE